MENSEFIMVFSSAGSLIEANNIAEALVSGKLAACVSIIPGVTSHYYWEDKKESSYEVMIVIKAPSKKFEELKKAIMELHSFEVPELLAVPIVGGSPEYIDWMRKHIDE